MLENFPRRVARFHYVVEMDDGQPLVLWDRHQIHLCLGDHAQGSFGPHDHARHVHLSAGIDEIVEVISAHPTHDLGVSSQDLVPVFPPDAQHISV